MTKYEGYQEEIKEDIQICIENMGCQPILFIGSGLSQRYFNAPNWESLLKQMAAICPKINMPFAYYKQTQNNLINIGGELTQEFQKWAWEEPQHFPPDLFTESALKDSYFKYKVAEFFEQLTPSEVEQIPKKYELEVGALQSIRPHSIITTNYDTLLEIIFPDYSPIIGQQVLHTEYASIGEIFKIHGSSTDYRTIVINSDDYDEFFRKKKYLSAKLLTCFAEHPLLFIGYNAEDPNIKAILSDIDELLTDEANALIPNLYFLQWNEKIEDTNLYSRERPIILDNGKSIRVKNIEANSFKWVFEAFSISNAIEKVNPKLLRALLARTYELVRTDVPRRTVDIDYRSLSAALHEESIAKIFGITSTINPKAFNINYPYTLSEVGKQLGYKGWQNANELIERIHSEKAVDLKLSDNRYHVAIRTSLKSVSRKYSQDFILLLEKVKNNEEYKLDL
jgi:hypothetical protein